MSVAFTWEQFHTDCPRYSSEWFWKFYFWIIATPSRRQWDIVCMYMCLNVCAELRSVFHIYPGILKTSLSFIYASTAEQNYTKNGQELGPIPANCNMLRWDFTSVIPRCVWDNASFYHRRITLIRIDRIESGLWKVNQIHCLLYEKEW